VTHQYTTAGNYTVTMDLFGDYGEYVETGKVDVVNASGATASFNASPSNATVGQTVTFDGSASTPSTGATISDYTWDFGDGTGDDSGGVATDTHAYSTPGTYTVKLTITDSNNETNSTTQQVTVTAQTTTTSSTTTTSPPPPPTSTSTSTNTGPPPPPSNNFAVTGTTAHGSDIVVSVSVPDAGRVEAKGVFKITVSKKVKHGKKTKTVKTTKLVTFADVTQSVAGGMATLTLAPSGSAVSALKGISKHSTVSVGLIIAFTPTGGTLNAKAGSVHVNGLQSKKKKKKK
jgi:PKD repeat protein